MAKNNIYKHSKWVLFLILLSLLFSCHENYSNYTSAKRFKIGDDKSWAKKNLDDSNWSKSREFVGDSIFWVRASLELKENKRPFEPQGLHIFAFGAYEVYWDGVLIGTNGKPGLENDLDKKGDSNRFFIVPDSLTKMGNHLIAMRMSQHYLQNNKNGIFFLLSDYYKMVRKPLILTLFIHILAGAFLLTAIYFFIFYLFGKKFFPTLLFSICSFFFFCLIGLEYLKYYYPIHYSYFYVRLEIIGVLTFLISFIIPLYFSILFALPRLKFFSLLYLSLLLIIYFLFHSQYDYTAELLGKIMWIVSVAIVGYAVFKIKNEAIIVLIALFINVVINYLLQYDLSLILSATILLLSMFYILALRFKEQRRDYEISLIQASRLKNELLKKKIQPHFLMNTLTSLIDWVEESPSKGVEFIEALAEEFVLLNQIENKKLIPLSQELKLCKSYLNIMKYRNEITYLWEDQINDDSKEIPPAIIHTLVENVVTHCVPNDNQILFQFDQETNHKFIKYTLTIIARIRKPNKEIKDGTGNKYIKARLTESFGNNWDFISQKTSNGWKSVIQINL